ncbi:hypothetical protein [Microbacterium sp. NIBRBAC000506063]|uniref:hypothetical protein n=1 Tax=Microbacterium sp. NIBRBAC000506063 TaxID=2734618 RepID=UPI001BB503E9|nr:hypothetical protein [Microbacterium sp. NIBRBAC000506063]QTV79015.1 hypothetical protein KAE78_07540 [Microbacterium sp. NIBRBAC000506063]
MTGADAARTRKRTWLVGGILLLIVVLLGLVREMVGPYLPWWVDRGLLAAAFVVFAIGLGRGGSVTGRRMLGTAALVILAVWQLLSPLLWRVLTPSEYESALGVLRVLGTAEQALVFALALIAVVQIGRTAVIPGPWNWAPAWALAAVVAVQLVSALIAATRGLLDHMLVIVFVGVGGVVAVAAQAFLGVLAIVLALRPVRPSTVNVYSSKQ